MKRIVLILAMLIALSAMSVVVNATGIINLELKTPGVGIFEIYASMASDDGYGIASIGFGVTGYDTLENWAPAAQGKVWTSSASGASQAVGFSMVLSDGVSPGQEGSIEVSQDLQPYQLVVGFGQTAGDLSVYFPRITGAKSSPYPCTTLYDEGMQPIYDAPLLLAKGTYSPGAAGPLLSYGIGGYLTSPTLNSEFVAETSDATVVLHNPAAVPEPSSMIALGSGVLGLFGFLRRRRG